MKHAASIAVVIAAFLSAPVLACPGGDMAGHEQGASTKKSAEQQTEKSGTADKKTDAKKT
ncbi:hypothetical protein OPU71_03955 [Niveibacterium sp. 24ML]|uniref:hypothetical protein n=1 Tax=Niveibacterium sp. 24ML TaxID=2985512 RepID=UPI00227002D6|nr:hypothetical protein [Niveibacterium sp. 24ML]MCX9155271.1 hypothetical protein [Niveibacterium sp. 24ML]